MMTNRSKLFKLLLVLFILVGLYSCEKEKVVVVEYGKITGYILDARTNVPVPLANVTTNPPSSSVMSDENGMFEIDQVQAGDIVINVKKDLYKTGTTKVSVQPNQTTEVIISIDPDDPTQLIVQFSSPVPANQSVDMPTKVVTLAWKVQDNAGYDSLRFDVIMFQSGNLEQVVVASDLSDTTTTVELLDFGKTYFWQVIAKEYDQELNRSGVWTFSTLPFPDQPFFYAQMTDYTNYEIFNSDSTVNDTTAPLIQLTDYPGSFSWNPQLGPKLNWIAFTSNRDIEPHIYIMRRDGSDVQKVTTLPNISYANQGEGYCWHDNGEALFYSYYDKLYRINRNGTGLTLMATAPADRNFRQVDQNSYNGKIIIQTMGQLIYDAEIYVIDWNGANMQLLVPNNPGRTESPTFSIDGSHFMFTHDVSGYNSVDGRQLDAQIFILSLDLQDTLNISFENKMEGTNDLQPRFSPDGAFVICMNENNTGIGRKDIIIMDYDGTDRRTIVSDAQMPYWGATEF